jgi:F-type H+-transporting ATPase subunit b
MKRLLVAALALPGGEALASGGEEGGGGPSLIEPQFGLIFWTVVTFVILLYVLKRVAWKPLLSAVQEREQNIQSHIDEARKQRDEAEALLAEHRQLMDQARQQTAEIVSRGQKDAERLVEEAKEKARAESGRLVEQARRQIDQETRTALAKVRGTVADLAIAAAGRLLGRSVDDDAHRNLVEDYVRDLENLAGSGKKDSPPLS